MLAAETRLPVEFAPVNDDDFGLSVQKPPSPAAPKKSSPLAKSSARQVITEVRLAALTSTEDSEEAAQAAMRRAAAASHDSALSYDSKNWCATLMHVRFGVNRFVALPWAFVTGCCILIEMLSLIDPAMAISGGVTVALGGLMSLLLAFRLNTSFGRWWEARNLWGTVILGSRSLVLQLLCSRPDAPHTEHIRSDTPPTPEHVRAANGGGDKGGGKSPGYVADDAQYDVVSSAAAWSLGFAVATYLPPRTATRP